MEDDLSAVSRSSESGENCVTMAHRLLLRTEVAAVPFVSKAAVSQPARLLCYRGRVAAISFKSRTAISESGCCSNWSATCSQSSFCCGLLCFEAIHRASPLSGGSRLGGMLLFIDNPAICRLNVMWG